MCACTLRTRERENMCPEGGEMMSSRRERSDFICNIRGGSFGRQKGGKRRDLSTKRRRKGSLDFRKEEISGG